MGLRQRAYWLRQAEAIRRRYIMTVAHAIAIAFADGEDRQKMIDELELVETEKESKEKRAKATWDMLFFMRGGYGV